jgi:anti-sigma B factor antagonist
MATLDRKRREAGGLDVELEQEGERVVLRARGELDLSSVKKFEAALRGAIRWSDFGVLLDLSGVTFIDSTGLHALIAAWTLSLRSRRELVVLSASTQVKQVIEMSGLEDLLPLSH